MDSSSVQTTTERLDENKAKLRVEVEESALGPSLDAAYRRWAKEVSVHGFRKGRVPRQLIDARVGAETVREEALRDALPNFYVEALRAEDLEAIAPPEINIVAFEQGTPIVFEATVDLRPEVVVPDLDSISVKAPPSEVTDEDLDEQIERLRDRYAELDTVHREARRGDYVVVDLKGYRNGELVEGVSSPDLLYEIGSRSGPPKLDDELENTKPGAILKFTDVLGGNAGDLAGEEISFTVLVKEVKAKSLPPVDDEFAKTVGEYDTLDELKEDLRERLGAYKRQVVAEQVRGLVLEELVRSANLEAPDVLVEEELEHRLSHLEADLAQAGLTLEQYVSQMDQTELEFRSALRSQVVASVKAELLLEEIAREHDLQISDEEVGREIAYLAARTEQDPQDLAKQLAESGRLRAVVADVMRRKALDHVVAHADVEGFEMPEAPPEPEDATEAGVAQPSSPAET